MIIAVSALPRSGRLRSRLRYAALITMYGAVVRIMGGENQRPEQFLGWHRYFLLELENLLREMDECLAIPYWPWERESDHPWVSALWGPDPATGGFGGRSDWGGCVEDGVFSSEHFATTPFDGARCLQRLLSGNVPSAFDVAAVIRRPRLAGQKLDFETELRGLSDMVHTAIGGQMGSAAVAPNAPEFVLHHANVDRIWSLAQEAAISGGRRPGSADLDTALTWFEGLTVRAVSNVSSLPAGVCVTYAEPGTTASQWPRQDTDDPVTGDGDQAPGGGSTNASSTGATATRAATITGGRQRAALPATEISKLLVAAPRTFYAVGGGAWSIPRLRLFGISQSLAFQRQTATDTTEDQLLAALEQTFASRLSQPSVQLEELQALPWIEREFIFAVGVEYSGLRRVSRRAQAQHVSVRHAERERRATSRPQPGGRPRLDKAKQSRWYMEFRG